MNINNILKIKINYHEIICMISLWSIGVGFNKNIFLSTIFLILCVIISIFCASVESKISFIFECDRVDVKIKNISINDLYLASDHINEIINKAESRNVRN